MVSDSNLDAAPVQPVDVTQNITYKLVLLSNTLGRSVGKLYEQHIGLTVPEWRVISVVGTKGPLSLAELTQTLAVDKGWVSRTVTLLEKRGLIGRTPDPADGRQFFLELSSAGKTLHLKGSEISRARQKSIEERLSASELESLDTLLTRLQSIAEDLL